jgi:integrase/recombinase XerD
MDSGKVSTCLYVSREVLANAKQLGLNVSKVSENALVEAIGRLRGPKPATGSACDEFGEGRDRDLNPGARLHRPDGNASGEDLLAKFHDFCRVDLGLLESTVKDYRRKARRFLEVVKKTPTDIAVEDVRSYLKPLADGNANTYGNALKPLKAFFRHFMGMPEVVESFKFRKIALAPVIIPSKEQLKKFFETLRTPIARALFLMYASSGLRKMELLSLKKEDVDWESRMIIPKNHNGETKKSWVAFFNQEAERALKEYLATRKDTSPKLFRISPQNFVDIWKYASQESGVRITPQVLREWFCDEMGRLGTPDRYVDAFCGRVPSSVLAKRYSDYAPEKLKQIYDKAGLRAQV